MPAEIPTLFACDQSIEGCGTPTPVLLNCTKMISIDTLGQYQDLYPYPDIVNSPNCGEFYNYDCGNRLAPDGHYFCNISSSDFRTYSEPTKSFNVNGYLNWYHSSSANVETTLTDAAFKNVYAKKILQGRPSYDSDAYQLYNHGHWDGCMWHESSGPDSTRYLAISATGHKNYNTKNYTITTTDVICCSGDATFAGSSRAKTLDSETDVSGDAACSTHVDAYGNFTVDGYGSSGTYAAEALALMSMADGTVDDVRKRAADDIAYQTSYVSYPDEIIESGDTSFTLNWYTTQHCYDVCTGAYEDILQVVHSISYNFAAGTLDITDYGPDQSVDFSNSDCDYHCYPWIVVRTEHWSVSGTNFTYTWSYYTVSSSRGQIYTDTENAHGTLSSPYTQADVITSCIALLDNWSMADDNLLPWRSTGYKTTGPLICYNEIYNWPHIASSATATTYGETFGQPAPAGIDRVWNPLHENWCTCTFNNGDQDCEVFYRSSTGAWNDGDGSPGTPRATQWLNAQQSNKIPEGAFSMCNTFFTLKSSCEEANTPIIDDEYWMCKYAEKISNKIGIDYRQPCGVNRFQISASSERCVSASDGTTLTTEQATTGYSNGDYVYIASVDLVDDGCYQVNNTGANTLAITKCVITGSDLPSEPFTLSSGDTGIVCKLKWQNLTYQSGICGTIGCNLVGSNPVTCSASEPTWLIDGDVVDIDGSIYTIKYITNQSFGLVGTTTLTKTTGTLRSIHGLDFPGAKANGDFTSIAYTWDYRQVGEYDRIAAVKAAFEANVPPCSTGVLPTLPQPNPDSQYDSNLELLAATQRNIQSSPCNSSVAYFSPNTELFADATKAISCGWISVGIDIYPSKWNGVIRQSMDNPWRPEYPRVCSLNDDEITFGFNCSQETDSGRCLTDIDPPLPCKRYVPLDLVEATLVLPNGSPALPAGKYLNIIPVNDASTQGLLLPPPETAPEDILTELPDQCGGFIVKPFDLSIPWRVGQNSCICLGGRWSDFYSQQGARCLSATVPAP